MALSRDPLKQKIGQMLILGFQEAVLTPDAEIVHAILNHHLGGVILFDYDFQTKTFDHNIKNPTQVKQLTTQLQDYAKQASELRGEKFSPLLVSIDYEGGKVNRLKEQYGFPRTYSAAELGTLADEEITLHAKEMAEVLREVGINLNFAPVLDVNSYPDNPVIGKLNRSFSSDPQRVTTCGGIFTKVFNENGIVSAYKHFPGHGNSRGDTHVGLVDVTKTWDDSELIPYQALLPEVSDFTMVMVAHVVHRRLDPEGYPASLSRAIIQGVLRDQLKFSGVVVTDDLQMQAVTKHYGVRETIRLAINAGADLLVFGNQLVHPAQRAEDIIAMIYQDVEAGLIEESTIEAAYQRIMHLKNQLQGAQLSYSPACAVSSFRA